MDKGWGGKVGGTLDCISSIFEEAALDREVPAVLEKGFSRLSSDLGLIEAEIAGSGGVYYHWSRESGLNFSFSGPFQHSNKKRLAFFDKRRLFRVPICDKGKETCVFTFLLKDGFYTDQDVGALLELAAVALYNVIAVHNAALFLEKSTDDYFTSVSGAGGNFSYAPRGEPKYSIEKAESVWAEEKSTEKISEIDKAIVKYLANISHEIRTPVHSIAGFLYLLKDKAVTAEAKDCLKTLENFASNLFEKVDFLLEVIGAEYEDFSGSETAFDIFEELRSVVRFFTAGAAKENILFRTFINNAIPEKIFGNGLLIRKILYITIKHAMKLTPKGAAVDFDVDIVSRTETTADISFIISNRGEGALKNIVLDELMIEAAVVKKYLACMGSELFIETNGARVSATHFTISFKIGEEKREEAFKPRTAFYIEYPSFSVSFHKFLKSAGFNPVRKTKVDMEQTDVFIVSAFNMTKSTVDRIYALKCRLAYVPVVVMVYKCRKDALKKLMDMDVTVILQPVSIYRIKGLTDLLSHGCGLNDIEEDRPSFSGKVLIVDDNRVNGRLLGIILEKYGVDVTVAESGHEAVEIFSKGFDLIFMDINMPVMDGVTATKRIINLSLEKGLEPPVIIAITANLHSNSKEYIEAGMHGVLQKPVEMEKLEKILKSYLK